MPVISFNKKYLYDLLWKGIDEHTLKDQVSKMGFEVEEIGKDEINLEITPNRLDLLDAVGFARAMKNFTHKGKRYSYRIETTEPAFTIVIHPSVKKIRPYLAAVVAEGLEMNEEALLNLINFSEKFCDTFGRTRRKVAIGLHNLDKVKPPLVYRCGVDENFVHLGSKEPVSYSKILESHDKGKVYSGIVKSANVCYYPEIIDSEGVIGFIPIINSERTRVTSNTKNIFMEVTGTSQYAVNKAVELFAATFMDMGGTVKRVRVNYEGKFVDTPEMAENLIAIPLTRIEKSIGVVIGFNNIISLANKMGYEAALIGNNIRFKVPEYRLDIIDEQDIIEDIAIGYGYDYIKPIAIPYTQSGSLEIETVFNRRTAEIMVGLGFSEFANSYLTNEDVNFDKPCIDRENSAVVLKNPKTEAISIMRTWLLPSLLKNLQMSTHESLPQKAFELDLIFKVRNRKALENYHLGAISVDSKGNFNDVKADVQGLLDTLGVEYTFAEHSHKSFIEGRCAEVLVNGKGVGFFGELHPKTLRNFGIEESATAFEIEIDRLHKKE